MFYTLLKHTFSSSALCLLPAHLFFISLADSASSAQPEQAGLPLVQAPHASPSLYSLSPGHLALPYIDSHRDPDDSQSRCPDQVCLMSIGLTHLSTSHSTCPIGCSKAGDIQQIQVPTHQPHPLLSPDGLPTLSSSRTAPNPPSWVSQKLSSQT